MTVFRPLAAVAAAALSGLSWVMFWLQEYEAGVILLTGVAVTLALIAVSKSLETSQRGETA